MSDALGFAIYAILVAIYFQGGEDKFRPLDFAFFVFSSFWVVVALSERA